MNNGKLLPVRFPWKTCFAKKTMGRHLKKYKASFVFFSVPTMVECRRWGISGHVHIKQNKPQVASFVSWWSVGDSNS